MKNKVQPIHQRLILTTLLWALCGLFFTACRQEDFTEEFDENRQELRLRLSIADNYENGTEYIPMKEATRSGGPDTIHLSNEYRYIILEENSAGDFVVVDTDEALLDGSKTWLDYIEIDGTETYSNVVTTLRPGTYKLIIITSPRFLDFNADIKPGFVLPPASQPQNEKFAVKYQLFWHEYWQLPYDVFYAQTDFTITKTTGLNIPNSTSVNVQLTRRTSKFRLLLQETTAADYAAGVPYVRDLFTSQYFTGLVTLEQPGQSQFPWGLDVWGNLWYDPTPDPFQNDGHKYINCLTQAYGDYTKVSGVTNLKYYIPNYRGQIIGIYHFSQPGQSTLVRTKSSFEFVFDDRKEIHLDYSQQFTLENNKVTGIVFKMTDFYEEQGNYRYYGMEPVFDGPNLLDPSTLFHGNIEHED